MDNLIAWIKNNQTRAAAIAVLLGALAYTQLANKPRNLEDCLLKVSREAKTDEATTLGNTTCRIKFGE
tara:strand:- start:76 stop:279 length:204 start_codon:yes stop_codon:yes gene_type:complete